MFLTEYGGSEIWLSLVTEEVTVSVFLLLLSGKTFASKIN